jgi:hypothetical protein
LQTRSIVTTHQHQHYTHHHYTYTIHYTRTMSAHLHCTPPPQHALA